MAWFKGILLGLVICLVFLATPQLMFKSQTRTIRFDEDGFTTKTGSKPGERTWEEIERIADNWPLIPIVGKPQNVMVNPNRAFAYTPERAAFLETIKGWHGAKRALFQP